MTAIYTPLEEMGRLGLKRVLEKQEEPENGISSHYGIVIPGRLVERGSVKEITVTKTRKQKSGIKNKQEIFKE
jgi:DNA-binding LacI/PurR family transcriptional regulator